MVVIQITHMAAVTLGCHTNKVVILVIRINYVYFRKKCIFVRQPTVMAAMLIICMTTNSDRWHANYLLKEKTNIISPH